MENMISAGYDAIIIHFMGLRVCEKQIKKAFDKGIPVITVAAMGAGYPGVVAEVGPMDAGMAAPTAEFIASKLGPNDKVVTLHIPMLEQPTAAGCLRRASFQPIVAQSLRNSSTPLPETRFSGLTTRPRTFSWETRKKK